MISRPSALTQRVYGVSFSVLNLLASSSETSALFLAVSAIRHSSTYVDLKSRIACDAHARGCTRGHGRARGNVHAHAHAHDHARGGAGAGAALDRAGLR